MTYVKNVKPLPEIFVSKTKVNELVKNFKNNKHSILSESIGKEETRSAWYSLAQFEELIKEIYYLNADGLRVYFGAYSDNDGEYSSQLTLVFVPTQLNTETGKHRDIVIDDVPGFGERETLNKSMSESVMIDKGYDTLSLNPPAGINDECLYPFS